LLAMMRLAGVFMQSMLIEVVVFLYRLNVQEVPQIRLLEQMQRMMVNLLK
jgi:hypothetical protein